MVPAEQLIDALWGEDPPAAVRNGLQGLVSKLRRALGLDRASWPCVAAATHSSCRRKPSTCTASSSSSPRDVRRPPAVTASRAIELLAEADALWRGDALADFTYEDFASAAITRLSELRLAAVEERLDIELQLGRHQGVIGELEALVAAHPLRERLAAC